MISAHEALERMDRVRDEAGVPAGATFSFLEKRWIELDDDEVHPARPASADDTVSPRADRLVWVGKYSHMSSTWELALDETGILVRLRKSR
jgi:hypothetical protein